MKLDKTVWSQRWRKRSKLEDKAKPYEKKMKQNACAGLEDMYFKADMLDIADMTDMCDIYSESVSRSSVYNVELSLVLVIETVEVLEVLDMKGKQQTWKGKKKFRCTVDAYGKDFFVVTCTLSAFSLLDAEEDYDECELGRL